MLIRSRAESTTIKIGAQFVLLDRSQRPMIQGVGSVSDQSGSPPVVHLTELAMPPDTVEIIRVATRLKRPKTMWRTLRIVQWNAMVATAHLV
jgi:hypothetical protein